ncbi:MAG: hypothetical protein ACR2J3_04065 [Aridibacter sp.]
MKKIILFVFISSIMCGFVFAQTPFPELDKVKQIKLLESTRKDVKRILAEYEDDNDDDDYDQRFSNKNAEIKVIFSRGNCADDSAYWNVSEWVVTGLIIYLENSIKVKDIKLDLSKFKKEEIDKKYPEDYSYHNEDSGILVRIEENEIQTVVFYPPKNKKGFLCNNENALEIFSGKMRLVDSVLQTEIIYESPPAIITELILSKTEIIIGCSDDAVKNKNCPNGKREISITTVAVDPENDVLTYNYKVSGGRIIGQGAKVIWDLSGVKAGIYTITAGVDDGCGVCSETVTKTVVIK